MLKKHYKELVEKYLPNMFSATKGAKWGRKRSDGVEYVIDIAV